MIVSFHKLHGWNCGDEYYHFHVGSFHFHGEMRKIQEFWPAWGRRWSTWIGVVLCYVFIVSYKPTDVQPPQWQGSALAMPRSWVWTLALPFPFFSFIQLQFWLFFGSVGLIVGPLLFSNTYPSFACSTPGPIFYYLFYFSYLLY